MSRSVCGEMTLTECYEPIFISKNKRSQHIAAKKSLQRQIRQKKKKKLLLRLTIGCFMVHNYEYLMNLESMGGVTHNRKASVYFARFFHVSRMLCPFFCFVSLSGSLSVPPTKI